MRSDNSIPGHMSIMVGAKWGLPRLMGCRNGLLVEAIGFARRSSPLWEGVCVKVLLFFSEQLQRLLLEYERKKALVARFFGSLFTFVASISFSTIVNWLILPVVICLSQRLSHACLSISIYTVKLHMAH